jgi:hypothetical protein
MNLKRKKHLHISWKPPTNSKHQSTALKDQKFKKSSRTKTSPGYDLITGKILTELPIVGIKYLTQLFNAAMLKGYFLVQWKVTQIILILKPGKPPNELTSYWSISLLLIISKVFEKFHLKCLLPMVENKRLILNHQFGFRQRHSILEQTYCILQRINEALETNQYCLAAFLDISQAFDKVWHTGLLYKLRQSLPLNYYIILKSLNYYIILKSHLNSRYFLVNVENECIEESPL